MTEDIHWLDIDLEDAYASMGLDFDRASVARMYDYMLGGKDNFAVDRQAVAEAMQGDPNVLNLVRENRAFVRRATRFLAEERGIRQFLDIGSGLPTEENVHQVAQRVDPECRVVYVDNDPIVLAHGRAILAENERTGVITADLRRIDTILEHPDLRALIDWREPVAVLSVATLHFVNDEDDPWSTVATLRDASASGSYLAISHATADTVGERVSKVADTYRARTAGRGTPRTREEFERFFEGYDLVDPGVVLVPEWRPDRPVPVPEEYWFYAAVGRKP